MPVWKFEPLLELGHEGTLARPRTPTKAMSQELRSGYPRPAATPAPSRGMSPTPSTKTTTEPRVGHTCKHRRFLCLRTIASSPETPRRRPWWKLLEPQVGLLDHARCRSSMLVVHGRRVRVLDSPGPGRRFAVVGESGAAKGDSDVGGERRRYPGAPPTGEPRPADQLEPQTPATAEASEQPQHCSARRLDPARAFQRRRFLDGDHDGGSLARSGGYVQTLPARQAQYQLAERRASERLQAQFKMMSTFGNASRWASNMAYRMVDLPSGSRRTLPDQKRPATYDGLTWRTDSGVGKPQGSLPGTG